MEDLEKIAQDFGATISRGNRKPIFFLFRIFARKPLPILNLPSRFWTPEQWNDLMDRLGDLPVFISLGEPTIFSAGIFNMTKDFTGTMRGVPRGSTTTIKLKG